LGAILAGGSTATHNEACVNPVTRDVSAAGESIYLDERTVVPYDGGPESQRRAFYREANGLHGLQIGGRDLLGLGDHCGDAPGLPPPDRLLLCLGHCSVQ
jgi:hypothetical protein